MLHSHGDEQRRLGDRRALRGALALVAVFAVVERLDALRRAARDEGLEAA